MTTVRAAALLAAFAAVLLAAPARASACGGLLGSLLSDPCPTAPPAPDPGGSEEPDQPVPAPGVELGFNSSLALGDLATAAQELDAAAAAGATVQRVPIAWAGLQPTPDSPPVPESNPDSGVEKIDRFYSAALSRGIRPIFIMVSAPVWATRYRSCWLLDLRCRSMANSGTKFFPDWPFLDEFETFVRAVKERWPQALIESGNEPNHYWNHPDYTGTRAFAPSPDHFAGIQCAAYRGSKAVNADPVLAAGWADAHFTTYLTGVYEAGGDDCWDLGNVHLYSGETTALGADTPFARRLHELRTLRTEYGDSDPIWVSETGWTTSGGGWHEVTEAEQEDALRRAYNRLVTMDDIGAVVFHTLRDSPTADSPYNDPDSPQYGYGFLHEDWSPKPVYCSFSARAGASASGC